MIDAFVGGSVKNIVRKSLDKPLIKEVSQKRNEKLIYFGLAGPLLLDIIEWQDYLQEFIVVEESCLGTSEGNIRRNRQELLLKTSFTTKLRCSSDVINDFLTVLYGDIDSDIILKEEGDFGKKLPKKCFGVIYLDYYGGIFKAKHREDAIKKLIAIQKQNSEVNCEYVLFVTVENLDKGKKEKRALVEEILKNLKDAKVENGSLDCFSKFLSCCKYGLLQKIYVPLQIYFYTKSCGDDVMFYDPIIYQDEKKETKKGAEMLHFRFLISIQKDKRTATHMIKDIVDICNLKLLTVSDNKIIPYKEQIPELRLIKEV